MQAFVMNTRRAMFQDRTVRRALPHMAPFAPRDVLILDDIIDTAGTLTKTVEDAALGILEITVGNMVRAIRTLSIERGHDPRLTTDGRVQRRGVTAAPGRRRLGPRHQRPDHRAGRR